MQCVPSLEKKMEHEGVCLRVSVMWDFKRVGISRYRSAVTSESQFGYLTHPQLNTYRFCKNTNTYTYKKSRQAACTGGSLTVNEAHVSGTGEAAAQPQKA